MSSYSIIIVSGEDNLDPQLVYGSASPETLINERKDNVRKT